MSKPHSGSLSGAPPGVHATATPALLPKLLLREVSKAYGATVALRRGNLEIVPGEVHVLIGSNGSGKSTLCKIVAGTIAPDSGETVIDGRAVAVSGPQAARALGIGIFYQELSLAAHRTVAENICLSDLPRRAGLFIDRPALARKADRYIGFFETVAGDGFHADARVNGLRADQRQLVEIMKTLASEASILIFDEPTSALDRAQVKRFFEILRTLRDEGRSIIFISHRMDEIFEIGDRVTVIRDGQTVATSRIGDTDSTQVVRLMTGDEAPQFQAERTVDEADEPDEDPVLSVTGVSGAGFGDVSFTVGRGEIVGFGGLHGQGQSATLRAIFGATAVVSGEILLNGEPLRHSGPRPRIRRGCAYVSGDRGRDGIISGRPILENVTPVHALLDRRIVAWPSALKNSALPALEALRTKFSALADPINSLSGGNQQKVVIARWLIDRPDLLLLDDPTKGIDLSAKADLFNLIGELARKGMAIVLYSSEDGELLENADRILVFNGGSITRELRGADRTRYNLYTAAYEAA